jgi:hypothetical protein
VFEDLVRRAGEFKLLDDLNGMIDVHDHTGCTYSERLLQRERR